MEAEEFFEKKKANMRELWHLSDLQKKMVYILMEEYAALHIADVSDVRVCTCEMPAKMKGKNQCWRYKKPFKEFLQTDHDQLVCPDCKHPFTKEELQIKEHCFNCGWEFAN